MSNRSRFFNSSNPFLTEDSFAKSAQQESSFPISERRTADPAFMTVSGAVNKSIIMGLILIATAFFAAFTMNPALMFVGLIGGIIALLVTYFNPKIAYITAPLYAAFEGLLLGTISMAYANIYEPGIVTNAVMLTMFALFVMLVLYRTGVLRATEKFRSIVMTATGAIAVMYLVNMGLSFFGMNIPYLHQMSPIGIIISLVIIAVAALNLILDFDQFEKGEQYQAPKYMEWVSALGLLVTLVWLYLEILRLLSMFSSRD